MEELHTNYSRSAISERGRLAFVLVCLGFLGACYKAKDKLPPNEPPTYSVGIGDVGTINDSEIDTVKLSGGHKSSPIWLSLRSGNPTGYTFKCYFSDMPTCIKPSFDTITVGLSYDDWLVFKSTCDTGYYTANFNVYCKQFGLKTYPIRFNVR